MEKIEIKKKYSCFPENYFNLKYQIKCLKTKCKKFQISKKFSKKICTGLHWLAETCKFKTHVCKIPYKIDNLIPTSQVLVFLKSRRTNEFKNINFLKNPIPQLDS